MSLQVFYGSLCGDSIRFVQNQLYPLYPDFKDYVDITLVPFGRGSSVRALLCFNRCPNFTYLQAIDENGTLYYTCTYDVDNCSVTRIQLCAIDYLNGDLDATMDFVGCQMAFENDRSGETV